jgi:hypothetical protein
MEHWLAYFRSLMKPQNDCHNHGCLAQTQWETKITQWNIGGFVAVFKTSHRIVASSRKMANYLHWIAKYGFYLKHCAGSRFR